MSCEKSFYLISCDVTHITHLKKKKVLDPENLGDA